MLSAGLAAQKDNAASRPRCRPRTDKTFVLGQTVNAAALTAAVQQFILTRLTQRVTLRDLEDLTGCSAFQIIKAFRRCAATTPHMFIIRARIMKAIELLEQGGAPAQVAQDVGFVDQSHLIRHFKRICGKTPSRYLNEKAPRFAAHAAENRTLAV